MTRDIVLTGDTVLTKQFCSSSRLNLRQLGDTLSTGDVTVTHLESVPEGEANESYPAHRSLGGIHTAPDDIGRRLADVGIDVATLAGEHVLDHTYSGLFAAWRSLDAADVAHAGTGWDLADARSPTTVETSDGDVAVISAAATFHEHAIAGKTRGGTRRPGVCPLRHRTIVDDDHWEQVKREVQRDGYHGVVRNGDELLVNRPGTSLPVEQYVHDPRRATDGWTTETLPADRRELRERVTRAATDAETVVVYVHSHEYAHGGPFDEPPAFVRSFVETVARAGADIVVVQGSQALRGVDRVEDAVVFYGLGRLVRTRPGRPRLRQEESLLGSGDDLSPLDEGFAVARNRNTAIIPTCSVGDDGVESTMLDVVKRDDEGAPRLAADEKRRETLRTVDDRSSRFETSLCVELDNGKVVSTDE
ncbi:CapA family protein [Halobaculum sp. MBLA0143]|uniref:CapA family protein n=1 Tax=Halobaculum sp. MBLA0143 TaxID=3079933 RepID=UPI003523463A